jgi:hypothetical protein
MHDASGRFIDQRIARPGEPEAEVVVLVIEKNVLVESADLAKGHAAAKQISLGPTAAASGFCTAVASIRWRAPVVSMASGLRKRTNSRVQSAAP